MGTKQARKGRDRGRWGETENQRDQRGPDSTARAKQGQQRRQGEAGAGESGARAGPARLAAEGPRAAQREMTEMQRRQSGP